MKPSLLSRPKALRRCPKATGGDDSFADNRDLAAYFGWVKNRSMLLLFSGIHVVNSVISPIKVYYSRQDTTQRIGSMGSSSFFEQGDMP